MGTALILTQPRTIAFEGYAELPLRARQVRVRTLYSGISAGTEMSAYRGTSPFASKSWNPSRRIFQPAEEPGQKYPVSNLGYEEVGAEIRTSLIPPPPSLPDTGREGGEELFLLWYDILTDARNQSGYGLAVQFCLNRGHLEASCKRRNGPKSGITQN